MYCKYCGTEVAPDQKFCGGCGSAIGSSTGLAEPSTPSTAGDESGNARGDVPRKRKSPKVVIACAAALVVLVALAIGGCQLLGGSGSGNETSAEADAASAAASGGPASAASETAVVSGDYASAADDAGEPQDTASQQTDRADSQGADDQSMRYAAYREKVEECQAKYGEGGIEAAAGNLRQMKGLCIADLIDFDKDGDEELLVGYYDESQVSPAAGNNIADAQAYRAEVWGYENGSISKLFESGFQWTNGGFAYLPVYYRSGDVAMYTVEYSTDADNRSVGTNRIWALEGDSFDEITEYSTYGMWGTGELEYEIDGEKVDADVYKTHFDEVMGEHTSTSYWMTWNDSSQSEGERWDTLNNPDATLRITQETMGKLEGTGSEAEESAGEGAGASAEGASTGASDAWAQFPQTLMFSSGAGAWSTELTVDADGTFTGYYHDSDMGDTGDGYPNGTRRETHFEGAFTNPVKVSDYEYRMQIAKLEITDEPGEAFEDGVRIEYVTDSVYGLGSETSQPTGDFTLHLPGQALSAFSDSAALWLFIQNTSSQASDFYAIVNSSDPSSDLAFRTYESVASPPAEKGDDEAMLKQQVEAKAGHEILYWFYGDFNCDGTNEAMAIAGVPNEARNFEGEWTDGEIWYASKDETTQVGVPGVGNVLNGLIVDEQTGHSFLSVEVDGHGSGSSSRVYIPHSDGCSVPLFDVDGVGNFHNYDGKMIGYTQTWENGFHEYAWHEFEFHPDNDTFTSKGIFDITTSRVY